MLEPSAAAAATATTNTGTATTTTTLSGTIADSTSDSTSSCHDDDCCYWYHLRKYSSNKLHLSQAARVFERNDFQKCPRCRDGCRLSCGGDGGGGCGGGRASAAVRVLVRATSTISAQWYWVLELVLVCSSSFTIASQGTSKAVLLSPLEASSRMPTWLKMNHDCQLTVRGYEQAAVLLVHGHKRPATPPCSLIRPAASPAASRAALNKIVKPCGRLATRIGWQIKLFCSQHRLPPSIASASVNACNDESWTRGDSPKPPNPPPPYKKIQPVYCALQDCTLDPNLWWSLTVVSNMFLDTTVQGWVCGV